MRVVIAGCGRVGGDVAGTLGEEGHDVSVIDLDESTFQRLGGTFNGTTHRGSAYDVRVLREAGIEFADVFVAVTSSDNANLMAVQVARKVFGVPRTIARLDDPSRADAYRALDIHYIPASQLISRVIHEQVVEAEFDYHVTFPGTGEVEIVDMTLGPEAEGKTVAELELPDALRIAAVRRGGKTVIPDDDFLLREGDLLVAAARHGVRDRVSRYLEHDEERP
ncbi:MAG TPA: TrkA family potassium uptake protein [Actinobacteria bacterium]|nr:TrkA family potassium uptake protein [Actinomycetota bacterium]